MKRPLKNFYAYRPLPDGTEPPGLNPDGTVNEDRTVFKTRRYSMAVRKARRLLGPEVVVFTYKDFMDRSTWERVTVAPFQSLA